MYDFWDYLTGFLFLLPFALVALAFVAMFLIYVVIGFLMIFSQGGAITPDTEAGQKSNRRLDHEEEW
jgi:hypothetical protein